MLIEAPTPSASSQTIPLHSLTFPEVAASKKPVGDMSGYLVGGPDRKGANAIAPSTLWRTWQKDVQAASRREGAVPQAVQDYFQRTKGLTSPPKEGVDVKIYGSSPSAIQEEIVFEEPKIEIIGVDEAYKLDLGVLGSQITICPAPAERKRILTNPPRFATSFSGMQEFLICPRKWAASKYFKIVKFEETEAIKWGNRVHAAAENYLKKHTGQPHSLIDLQDLEPTKKYCDLFIRSGATLHVEKEMCFTKDMKLCGWKDWNTVWFRGKGDVISIKDRKLSVFDWKSGKLKTDTFQLEVMIALADLYYGDLFDVADGKLIFVKEQDPKKALVGLDKPITKDDIKGIWKRIFAITLRMEAAWQEENFRCTSNGLCKNYCDDLACPHNGRK